MVTLTLSCGLADLVSDLVEGKFPKFEVELPGLVSEAKGVEPVL
jgi:hypothetical protein